MRTTPRALLATAAALVAIAATSGCSGDGPPDEPDGASSTTAAADPPPAGGASVDPPVDPPVDPGTPVEVPGENADCVSAARTWADLMEAHVAAAASDPGPVDLSDTEAATAEVTATCSDAVAQPVIDANDAMEEGNADLAACGDGPECDDVIPAVAEEAGVLVSFVRTQLE